MSWSQTFTGRRFDPCRPDAAEICLEDIAHALSHICRFGGHSRTFYSVSQHSVHVSHIVPPEHARWGLLHDAAEAYVGDVVRPLKGNLTNYAGIERGVMGAIAKALGLTLPMPGCVHIADEIMLATEARVLMGVEYPMSDWGLNEDGLDENHKWYLRATWEPELAKMRFLERHYQLSKEAAA